jgi:hypothetical protein
MLFFHFNHLFNSTARNPSDIKYKKGRAISGTAFLLMRLRDDVKQTIFSVSGCLFPATDEDNVYSP